MDATTPDLHEKYVNRLRARLARPNITVEDARDGIVDCFVSTYHNGLKHGLKGMLGVDADPDKVAQVAGGIFRRRLKEHGASFESPTVESLEQVKDELDKELHFDELPVELQATHDQVCSLLLAKADGLIEHNGDRSVLRGRAPSPAPVPASAPSSASTRPERAPTSMQPSGQVRDTRTFTPPPSPAPATPSMGSNAARVTPRSSVPSVVAAPPSVPARPSSVSASLRSALAAYLDETRARVDEADVSELLSRLDRAKKLAQSIAEFTT